MKVHCGVHFCVSYDELQSDLNAALFLQLSRGFCLTVITHLHLVPMIRAAEATHPFPTCSPSLHRENMCVQFYFLLHFHSLHQFCLIMQQQTTQISRSPTYTHVTLYALCIILQYVYKPTRCTKFL